MKIVFEKLDAYRNWNVSKYDLIKTFSDIGYYFDNNLIFYYYVNRYPNRKFGEMLVIEKIIKNSIELKWCLLNYKTIFDNRISNSTRKIIYLFLEDRIKISEPVLEFEVIERD